MQMVETKYLMTRPGPMGSQGQSTAAATFFAKANQGCVRLCHKNDLVAMQQAIQNTFTRDLFYQ